MGLVPDHLDEANIVLKQTLLGAWVAQSVK